MQYVQFSDSSEVSVVSVFGNPQDPGEYPNQGEVQDDDPRYLAFINPPPDMLALQSAKLQALTQLTVAQKQALANRISTLNDAIDLEMATPEEEAELPIRTAQLKQWKTYAVLLGRVTSQIGWPPEVVWPAQPAAGMDLTVSAVAPDAA
ncbi:tail fiber assembly protein [Pseudomonas moorei]|uniref:Virus tail fibre assembly protein, lambda gpK n=1 Tax=Pseudomonas moorei TaxID=395599 RepID=A0A1H1FH51_9PSED|nr:tail fiber assembly protein [Pseudomonas moorei]KAB0509695.1 tail fiber assembly protein [Pseudomonas moorei]SDR00207.1 virus tail fibre assembly protein, lambda gpK [Pseudomonas moorei]